MGTVGIIGLHCSCPPSVPRPSGGWGRGRARSPRWCPRARPPRSPRARPSRRPCAARSRRGRGCGGREAAGRRPPTPGSPPARPPGRGAPSAGSARQPPLRRWSSTVSSNYQLITYRAAEEQEEDGGGQQQPRHDVQQGVHAQVEAAAAHQHAAHPGGEHRAGL